MAAPGGFRERRSFLFADLTPRGVSERLNSVPGTKGLPPAAPQRGTTLHAVLTCRPPSPPTDPRVPGRENVVACARPSSCVRAEVRGMLQHGTARQDAFHDAFDDDWPLSWRSHAPPSFPLHHR